MATRRAFHVRSSWLVVKAQWLFFKAKDGNALLVSAGD
jgi:hypothetical protein